MIVAKGTAYTKIHLFVQVTLYFVLLGPYGQNTLLHHLLEFELNLSPGLDKFWARIFEAASYNILYYL